MVSNVNLISVQYKENAQGGGCVVLLQVARLRWCSPSLVPVSRLWTIGPSPGRGTEDRVSATQPGDREKSRE